MPSQPIWFNRLPSILEQVRALDSDYLDRHAIELIFGVRERRARQLMAGLSTLRVGNAAVVRRKTLIESLETSLADNSHNAGSLPALERPVAPERPSAQRGEILMASNEMSQPGQPGNPAIQPEPSGKPAEIARSRLEFEDSSCEALLGDTRAYQVAKLLRDAVRKREPWAIQALQGLAGAVEQMNITGARRDHTAAKPANAPVIPAPGGADPQGASRATGRLATPAMDRLSRTQDAEAESACKGSQTERYEEFCRAKVKDHLKSLPPAARAQKFHDMRSAIRRATPQLRRNELDEIVPRKLELKIRAELHLPSIEEFFAGCV